MCEPKQNELKILKYTSKNNLRKYVTKLKSQENKRKYN